MDTQNASSLPKNFPHFVIYALEVIWINSSCREETGGCVILICSQIKQCHIEQGHTAGSLKLTSELYLCNCQMPRIRAPTSSFSSQESGLSPPLSNPKNQDSLLLAPTPGTEGGHICHPRTGPSGPAPTKAKPTASLSYHSAGCELTNFVSYFFNQKSCE